MFQPDRPDKPQKRSPLRLPRQITVSLYGQQIPPLWPSGNEAVQDTKTFHLPD
ncbi:hypothetical protein CORC01_05469 [Colletotrichum orchidophilum]|uniref:Uncharacterized protein n=1 Tax=Colletotrichum orchidophilum TaxID=1209926 RepID=A0A1G4BCP9_9PEZI|nr:uncharacterized protein CORC01_05469 [Colletotrichum orchidophilum]OHE99188.1 hypothetical protein CORC01_05469 [Colletotrichum orchidophilum]